MQITKEHLRCTESYRRRSRHDVCLIKMPDSSHMFVRLQALFTCHAANQLWKLALVTQFKTIQDPEQSITGMRRVCDSTQSSIIQTDWIVRSIHVASTFDFENDNQFFVNDLVDSDNASDVYLRLLNLTSVH